MDTCDHDGGIGTTVLHPVRFVTAIRYLCWDMRLGNDRRGSLQ